MSKLIFWKTKIKKKYLKVLSAVVVIGTLRINKRLESNQIQRIFDFFSVQSNYISLNVVFSREAIATSENTSFGVHVFRIVF